MSSSPHIFTGPWINHSHSALIGATLTLNNRDSAFLLAFLAIVVTTAGNSFWIIVAYIIHQARSKRITRDGIFYQHQAVLKNSTSALDAAWKFTLISLAWRRHERTKWWQFWRSRTFAFVVLALFLAGGFGVAGIFSSQVTKAASSEVLIQSDFCGKWTYSDVAKFQLKVLDAASTAANYARNCYGDVNASVTECGTYVVPQIPRTRDGNASCPFVTGNCFWSDTAAYQMSTGPMDSHDILGLNAGQSERITLSKQATCAPVHLRPYLQLLNITNNVPNGNGGSTPSKDTYLRLFVGGSSSTDWSYQYNTHAQTANIGYELVALGIDWDWVPAFDRADADVYMFLLFPNTVIYTYQNSDPFFSANRPSGFNISTDVSAFYFPDYLMYGIACAESYQICNPNVGGTADDVAGCTPHSSYLDLNNEFTKIGLNDYQLATTNRIMEALVVSNIFGAVNGRGALALQAQDTVFSSVVIDQAGRIPDNQWQIELDGWFAVSSARLQQELVQDASGLPDPIQRAGAVFTPPADKYEAAICNRQMIRNAPGYQNFSTLGVALILILGTVLIVLGLTIDTVVGLVQKKIKADYLRLSWTSDGYLQLQRMAWEGAGYGDWERCDDDVPTSRGMGRDNQKLGVLDISVPEHPHMMKPQDPISSPGSDAMRQV